MHTSPWSRLNGIIFMANRRSLMLVPHDGLKHHHRCFAFDQEPPLHADLSCSLSACRYVIQTVGEYFQLISWCGSLSKIGPTFCPRHSWCLQSVGSAQGQGHGQTSVSVMLYFSQWQSYLSVCQTWWLLLAMYVICQITNAIYLISVPLGSNSILVPR